MRPPTPRSLVSRCTVAVVLTAALAGSAAALPGPAAGTPAAQAREAAGTPILLSDDAASVPDVAVDADGTAHIAWREDRADGPWTVYCRLPRGASACQDQQDLGTTPTFQFGPVGVVLRRDGTVSVLAYYCCGEDEGTALWESTDGGATFGPPRTIGSVAPESVVEGPGLNTLMTGFSGSGAPLGAGVQVMPTDDSPVTGYATLDDTTEGGAYYSGGVALLDDTTPVTAYTDLEDTYVRVYDRSAGGDYNEAGNWDGSVLLPDEDEPTIVSGPSGAYLMTHVEYDDDPLRDAYQVRRLSPATGEPGMPFLATDIRDSLFGTLTADAAGGLTAVWTDEGDDAPIRASYSATGAGFTAPGTVVEGVRAFNLRVSTAGDGGGAVVWDENTDDGAAYVAVIPVGGVAPDGEPEEPPTSVGGFTPPDSTKACTRQVLVKPGVLAAVQGGGCFEESPKGSGRWSTTGDVNVNGIRFVGGKSSTTIGLDTVKHTISASAGVVQMAGPLVFSKDAGTWDVDGTTTFEGLEKFGITLLDLPALGRATVDFGKDEAFVTANLALPKPFDLVTGATTLRTTMLGGLDLRGITLKVPSLAIGEFGMRDLTVTYDASSSTWTGTVDLKLPPAGEYARLTLGLRQGKLVRLSFAYGGPPFPFQVYPGLWLKNAGFDYNGTNGFALGGGVDLAAPTPSGPITFDAIGSPPGTGGGFLFEQPSSGPAHLRIAGRMGLYGVDLAGASADFYTDGRFAFAAGFAFGLSRLGVSGDIAGAVDLDAGTFHAQAQAEVCVVFCAGAKGIVSDVGIAACASIEFGVDPFSFELAFLVGYQWATGLDVGTTCDLGAYLTPRSGGSGSSSEVVVGPDGTIFLPPGDARSYSVDVPGVGGVPLITVRDIDGDVVVASDPAAPLDPQNGDRVVLVPSEATSSVRVVIVTTASVAGSVFRVTASPAGRVLATRSAGAGHGDSARRETVPAFQVAASYPVSTVRATLAGAGRARTLTWEATNLADASRSLRFVETGEDGVAAILGETFASSGSLPVTVTGPAGPRTISAVVVDDRGQSVSSTEVATYDAPGPLLPGKATLLKAKLAKGGLVVSWRKGAGAPVDHWRVTVALQDGRRLLLDTTRTSLSIPKVGKKDRVQVVVTGVDALGLEGRPAKVVRR